MAEETNAAEYSTYYFPYWISRNCVLSYQLFFRINYNWNVSSFATCIGINILRQVNIWVMIRAIGPLRTRIYDCDWNKIDL